LCISDINPVLDACFTGNLSKLKDVIYDHIDDQCNVLDQKYQISTYICCACAKGHLNIIEWLVEEFQITVHDIRNYHFNPPIRLACSNGHLEVIKWFQDFISLDNALDININAITLPFNQACYSGHLEILKWLHSVFQFTCKEISNNRHEAFTSCCIGYHPEVGEWLQMMNVPRKQIVTSMKVI